MSGPEAAAALLRLVRKRPRASDGDLAECVALERGLGHEGGRKVVRAAKAQLLPDRGLALATLPCDSGGPKTFCILRPGFALQSLCAASQDFAGMLWGLVVDAHGRQVLGTAERPLGVVHFEDACTPGNALDAANRRKYSAWHWSVRQFDPWLLCQDWGWIPAAFPMLHDLQALAGGQASFCCELLRQFWAVDPLSAGVLVDSGPCTPAGVRGCPACISWGPSPQGPGGRGARSAGSLTAGGTPRQPS